MLKVLKREGNILSPVLRDGWDAVSVLGTLTKHNGETATGAHISLVGHITRAELHFSRADMGGGLANRFLYCCARRSKSLPEGGRMRDVDVAPLARQLQQAAVAVREGAPREMRRDEAARALWIEQYDQFPEPPGALGDAVTRAAPHVVRLSMLYAVADQSSTVRVEHLRAALEVWRYCFESARHLFGDGTGHDLADQIRDQLRHAGRSRVARTEISNAGSGNRSADEITRALELLESYHMARKETDSSKPGRPTDYWSATEDSQTYEINELSPEEDDDAGTNSFNSSVLGGARISPLGCRTLREGRTF